MARLAVCSRQVVTFDKSAPSAAVVLVEDGFIVDVVEIDPLLPISDVMAIYRDWNPIDYSNFVISPGQIDSNVKINPDWESLEDATFTAVASGVTSLLVETNLFERECDYSKLHCDVGDMEVVFCAENIATALLNGSIAVKAYLFPPNQKVPKVDNLLNIFASAKVSGLPMVIDPLSPTDRVIMTVSPCRLKPYSERLTYEDKKTNFAAAYPDDIESAVGEDEENDMCDLRSALLEQIIEKSPRPDIILNMIKVKTPHRIIFKAVVKQPDVISSLNKRLGGQDRGMQVLSQAETVTYIDSGTTTFTKLAEIVADNSERIEQAETAALTFKERLAARRPTPILTLKKSNSSPFSDVESQLYSNYLANYPESWEEAGVENVIAALKHETCNLHLTNITSAAAYRQVILARGLGLSVTCDVGVCNLYFTSDKVQLADTRFKASPPVRSAANRDLLWELLQLKVINCVTSSHLAVTPEYKNLDEGNFNKAVSGVNSLGFTGQALWTLLHKAYYPHSLQHLITRHAKWTSLEPAKIFGLDSHFGSIERGKRADFCIWRPDVQTPTHTTGSSQPKTCVFLGQEMLGSIEAVYIRGRLAYAGGQSMQAGSRIRKQPT